MKFSPKICIYLIAALALVVGGIAYGISDHDHDHEEEGLIEGDFAKVAIVGALLAGVAIVSFVYLAKNPPREG